MSTPASSPEAYDVQINVGQPLLAVFVDGVNGGVSELIWSTGRVKLPPGVYQASTVFPRHGPISRVFEVSAESDKEIDLTPQGEPRHSATRAFSTETLKPGWPEVEAVVFYSLHCWQDASSCPSDQYCIDDARIYEDRVEIPVHVQAVSTTSLQVKLASGLAINVVLPCFGSSNLSSSCELIISSNGEGITQSERQMREVHRNRQAGVFAEIHRLWQTPSRLLAHGIYDVLQHSAIEYGARSFAASPEGTGRGRHVEARTD